MATSRVCSGVCSGRDLPASACRFHGKSLACWESFKAAYVIIYSIFFSILQYEYYYYLNYKVTIDTKLIAIYLYIYNHY